MKKISLAIAASSTLFLISTTCRADDFYIDKNDPTRNAFVYHNKDGRYNITALDYCKETGKPGARICITLGEGTDCNIDASPGHPNRFSFTNPDGTPGTTVIIRTSPRSSESVACGVALPGKRGEGQTIIKK